MKKLIVFMTLLPFIWMTNCTSSEKDYIQKTIFLRDYEKYKNDSGRKHLDFIMKNIYPAQRDCDSRNNYANLYIAKQLNDSIIYIFEPCSKVSNYAYDTTGRYVPMIYSSDIISYKNDSIKIFVPANFKLSKKVKYLVAKVNILGES